MKPKCKRQRRNEVEQEEKKKNKIVSKERNERLGRKEGRKRPYLMPDKSYEEALDGYQSITPHTLDTAIKMKLALKKMNWGRVKKHTYKTEI
ncbi:hypothetical protein C2G38_2161337 [Gigaspora rosea]|uniref:Uncharacterized protein n=1 Tax=Gigaspora rosea TaxID=44941 RepID=A0A397VZ97_9GLOM|nr:hypothetical protein C2G38_2161337 [Gigaspora rosea]